jgi:hypothetical protein
MDGGCAVQSVIQMPHPFIAPLTGSGEAAVGRMKGSPGRAGSTRPPRAVSTDISCVCLGDVLKSIVTDSCGITRRAVSGRCVGQRESRHFDLRTEE